MIFRPTPHLPGDAPKEIMLVVDGDEYVMRFGDGERAKISGGPNVAEIGKGGTFFAGDRSRVRLEGDHLQVVAQAEPVFRGDEENAIHLVMPPRKFDGRRQVFDYRIRSLPGEGESRGDIRIEPLDAYTSAFRGMDERSARLKLAQLAKRPSRKPS